jgi:hypothetical protein
MSDRARLYDDEFRLTLADERELNREDIDMSMPAGTRRGEVGFETLKPGRTNESAHNATGSDDDPVMPSDDATLKTKI